MMMELVKTSQMQLYNSIHPVPNPNNNYLRRGQYDGTIYVGFTQVLDNRQVLIRRSRWRVDDQEIQLSPVNIT